MLITGGQGFTGRHVTARWLADDPDVHIVATGRSPELAETFTHAVTWCGDDVVAPVPRAIRPGRLDLDRYRYLQVDLTDTARLAGVLAEESIDAVVHLAASLRDSPFESLVRNNVVGTQSLLEAAQQSGREDLRIVICSSGSVYGAVPEAALPISEDRPPTPIDTYSVTKRAAEDLASVHRRAFGLDIVIARIFNVAGPGEDERHLTPNLGRQFAERRAGAVSGNVKVGPLDTTRDFVDVRDVARALIVLASSDRSDDVVNVASGTESRTRDVFEILSELAGVPVPAPEALPPRRLDFQRQCADISRLRSLGFVPEFSLRDTLETILRYYLDEVASSAS